VDIRMKQSTVSNIPKVATKIPLSGSAPRRPESKNTQLVNLLSKPKGAWITSLCKTLDWQTHTVRAAISRLRAKGYVIETSKATKDGVTIYKIIGKPAEGIQT